MSTMFEGTILNFKSANITEMAASGNIFKSQTLNLLACY
jgi:hypothetical protein